MRIRCGKRLARVLNGSHLSDVGRHRPLVPGSLAQHDGFTCGGRRKGHMQVVLQAPKIVVECLISADRRLFFRLSDSPMADPD